MGYFVAILLFAGSFYVWYYNDTHTNSYLLFPLLDAIPSLRGNLEAQAEWSWRIGVGVGLFVLLLTIATSLRRASIRKISGQ